MPLSDIGLVCRYYIDEAASGTTPTQADDAGANAYHLTNVNYGAGNMAYVEIGGNRGLESTSLTGAQRARRTINDTSDALRDAMAGVQKATIELVLRLDGGNTNGGRIFGINGRAGENGRFMLKAPTDASTVLRVAWNDVDPFDDTAALGTTRAVVHVVIDTTLATAVDRVRVYKNGALLTAIGSNMAQNDTLSLPSGQDLIALNRESSGSFDRSIDGVLFYAAMYSVAFDSTRVSDHETILAADDDTPASGGQTTPSVGSRSTRAILLAWS